MKGSILCFVVLEAGTTLLMKQLLNLAIHPYFVVLVSGLAASALMAVAFWRQPSFKKELLNLKVIKSIWPTAVFITLGNLFGFAALKLTRATNYILLARTSVLLSPILAWLILREKVNHKIWPLVASVLLGIWLLTGDWRLIFNLSGDSLAALTALTISLDFIWQKRAMIKVPLELMAFWRRLLSAILVGGIWLVTPQLGQTSFHFTGLGGMALGFAGMSFFMARALKVQAVAEFNLLINLSPVLVGLSAYFLFGERLSGGQLVGAAFIIGSLVTFNLIKKQESLKLKAKR